MVEFTEEQKKVIDARDCSLIVSAAAGSGKTAVLVERILGLITDSDNPVDIDTLLVVTFTNAAAAQMKDKIRDALAKRLEIAPDDANLRRQSSLIHNAKITTIDSFCQYVLRNSFDRTDADPGFRIAEPGENTLLESDVLDKLIEEKYGSGDEDFLYMVDHLATGAHDSGVAEAVMKIYRVAESDPWPKAWLDKCMHAQEIPEGAGLPEDIEKKIIRKATQDVSIALDIYRQALELADTGNLHPDYIAVIASERDYLKEISERMTADPDMGYDGLIALFASLDYEALSRKKNPDEDKSIRDRVRDMRNRVKGMMLKLRDSYMSVPSTEAADRIRECSRTISALCRLTTEYMEALKEAKADRGILSFADIEHYALDILVRPTEDGGWEPTDAAAQYRGFFSYVFIDEYQDSNMIQELILSAVSGESEGLNNRFMVGDIKQSIYRFRQADPSIFIRKYDGYEYEGADRRKIDLNRNFRSRIQVLDSCNALFERVMDAESGGTDYDEHASLKYGASYPEGRPDDYVTEVMLVKTSEGETSDRAMTEGEAIARRIDELMSSGMQVWDTATGTMRPLRYGDIVILYRSSASDAECYKKILESHSVSAILTGSSGYFSTYEISALMNLLRIIVNPLQDIPFYGTMESVIGGFTPEEIAAVSLAYRQSLPEGEHAGEGYLYEACRYAAAQGDERSAGFLDMLTRYREMSAYMSVDELLGVILDDTGYRNLMLAMRGGPRRVANVDMLIRKAVDFAGTSYFGLYNFIRYIDLLRKSETDDEEAEAPGEIRDTVRIMTIHKSKGLEFPVVIVAREGSEFNLTDTRGAVLCDHDSGIAVRNIDTRRRIRYDNLMYRYVSDEISSQSVAEEMRIQYVAMTRAREKLILVAALKDERPTGDEDTAADVLVLKRPEKPARYIDWYLQCLCDAVGCDRLDLTTEINTEDSLYVKWYKADLSARTAEDTQLLSAVDSTLLMKQLDDAVRSGISSEAYRSYLDGIYAYEYPHTDLSGLYTKTSVSVLKHAAMPDDFEPVHEMITGEIDDTVSPEVISAAPVPGFISGTLDKPGATVRGSAFHRIMELFDLVGLHNADEAPDSAVHEALTSQIVTYAADKRLSEVEKHILDDPAELRLIEEFLGSDTARRMAAAQQNGQLFREAPFMMGIPASRVDERFPEDETVLIQGIIDVYWIEDGEAVILDYKTDRVHSASRLVDLYKTQLDLYGQALEQMHIPVREKLIYSFALGEIISL